jgi:hypothetical protein
MMNSGTLKGENANQPRSASRSSLDIEKYYTANAEQREVVNPRRNSMLNSLSFDLDESMRNEGHVGILGSILCNQELLAPLSLSRVSSSLSFLHSVNMYIYATVLFFKTASIV